MRRFLLVALLLAVTLFAAALQAEPPRNRLLTQPTPPTDAALAPLGLRKAWCTNVGVAGLRDGLASAQAFDGQLITQTLGGCFTCLDAETGAQQWQVRPGQPFPQHHRPVGANRHYFFLYSGLQLTGVERKTGLVEWVMDLPLPLDSAPTADEVNLYLTTSDHKIRSYFLPLTRQLKSETDQAAYDAMLSRRGLSPEKFGSSRPKELWSFDLGSPPAEPPAAFGSHIIVGDERGNVLCFENGRRYMSDTFRTGGAIVAPIAQDGDMAFIASADHHVYAVELIGGRLEPRWQFTAGGRVLQRPMVVGNDVFIVGSLEGMHRVDRASGREVWSQPRARRFLAASPRLVIALDANHQLVTLDRQRGTLLGSLDVSGFAFQPGNAHSDRAYLANHNGMALCLRDADAACSKPVRYEAKLSTAMAAAAREFGKSKKEAEEQKKAEKAKDKAKEGEEAKPEGGDGMKEDKTEDKNAEKKEGKGEEGAPVPNPPKGSDKKDAMKDG